MWLLLSQYAEIRHVADNSLYAALDSLLAAMSLSWTAESRVPGATTEEQKHFIIRVYLQQQVGHTCLALIELRDRDGADILLNCINTQHACLMAVMVLPCLTVNVIRYLPAEKALHVMSYGGLFLLMCSISAKPQLG